MKDKRMRTNLHIIAVLLLLAGAAFASVDSFISIAQAEEEHGGHDNHGHEKEGNVHKDEDAQHDDSQGHEEHGDDHEDEESREHGEESEEGHGHGGHDEHEEEGKSEISPDAAKRAGVITEIVGSKTIYETITLTGRITLNRDRTYAIRARFPGVVRDVKVKWGQEVKEGQVLAVIESNESLKSYNVTAPRSGVVLERNTNIGDVADEEPIFTIADLSTVWAEFHAFPRDLPNIKEGQMVRTHTLENGKEVNSPIFMMLPTADALSQTVIAIVSIPNRDKAWRPGMTVEGHVAIGERNAKLAVTEEAIQRMEDKTVVFVKEGEKNYEPREVTLGKSDGKYVEVLNGLKGGEEYVKSSSFTIKADILKSTAEHSH
jgi:cobalt-zinc-cadmium efflux system membrane fusion protein